MIIKKKYLYSFVCGVASIDDLAENLGMAENSFDSGAYPGVHISIADESLDPGAGVHISIADENLDAGAGVHISIS